MFGRRVYNEWKVSDRFHIIIIIFWQRWVFPPLSGKIWRLFRITNYSKLALFQRSQNAPIKSGCFRVKNSPLKRTKTAQKKGAKTYHISTESKRAGWGSQFRLLIWAKMALLKLLWMDHHIERKHNYFADNKNFTLAKYLETCWDKQKIVYQNYFKLSFQNHFWCHWIIISFN